MQKQVEDTRRIRHDLRHHDFMIAEYVRNGEREALLDFLERREEQYEEGIPARLCENITVNNILEVYIREAKKKGIEVLSQVMVGRDAGMHENDFIAILGNAMENAIHGCEESGQDEKRIQVFMRQRDGKLAIRIANTCGENLRFQDGIPKRKEGGGIGVASMLRSVKKYDGEADFEVENGEFVLRILLKVPVDYE